MLERNEPPPMPAVGLVVSGGHTALYRVGSWLDVELIGSTIDDAVGEAYDKVAALLGLGYPGGPIIDSLAEKGDPKAIEFPRTTLGRESLDFSFSGLKTAVLYHVHGVPKRGKTIDTSKPPTISEQHLCDIAASFQAACTDVIVKKLKRAIGATRARIRHHRRRRVRQSRTARGDENCPRPGFLSADEVLHGQRGDERGPGRGVFSRAAIQPARSRRDHVQSVSRAVRRKEQRRWKRLKPRPPLPPRPVEGHKGLFGRVLVVGGSEGMIGAPVLAATSSLRMGAGLVQIAVPKAILPACLSITPELIGIGLRKSASKGELTEAIEKADAIVVGPGLGRSPAAAARLKVLIRTEKPMVLDADALNLIAEMKHWPKSFKAKAVLTPHPGRNGSPREIVRRIESAERRRRSNQNRVARVEGIRTGDRIERRSNHRHRRREALRQPHRRQLPLQGGRRRRVVRIDRDACSRKRCARSTPACAGVFMHGRAGEIAGKKLGRRSVLARDVIDAIPQAIADYENRSN